MLILCYTTSAPGPMQICLRLLRLVLIWAMVGVYCYECLAMFDHCLPRTNMAPHSQVQAYHTAHISLTDTEGGQSMYRAMESISCVLTLSTVPGHRLAMILSDADTLNRTEIRSRLYRWGYGGTGSVSGSVWRVTNERGQLVETLRYRGANGHPRVIHPQSVPATQLRFSLNGVSNISRVPIGWKFEWLVWSVGEDVIYHNNDHARGLQNPCRNGTIVVNWTTPRTFVHSKHDVLPNVFLRSSDCQVDIVPPDDSSTLDYLLVTTIHDLIPHMTKHQMLVISYRKTYGGPWEGCQWFEKYKPRMTHNISVDGVFGVRYSFRTGGQPMSPHLAFAFNISRVGPPIAFMDVTTSDSTLTSTQNRTTQSHTAPMPSTPPTIMEIGTHDDGIERIKGRPSPTAPPNPLPQPVSVYVCVAVVIIALISLGAAVIARLIRPHSVTPAQTLIDEIRLNDSIVASRGTDLNNDAVQPAATF